MAHTIKILLNSVSLKDRVSLKKECFKFTEKQEIIRKPRRRFNTLE